MDYYEEREKKNEEFVVCWAYICAFLLIGGAVFVFGLWFVRLMMSIFS